MEFCVGAAAWPAAGVDAGPRQCAGSLASRYCGNQAAIAENSQEEPCAPTRAHPIYMRFLYCWPRSPLEKIWRSVPPTRRLHGVREAGLNIQTTRRRPRPWYVDRRVLEGAIQMLDLIMLAVGLGFFALSVGYAYACERL